MSTDQQNPTQNGRRGNVGAGISIRNCKGATIKDCEATDNVVDIYICDSTSTHIENTRTAQERIMTEQKTSGIIITNSPNTSLKKVTSTGHDLNIHLDQSPDSTLEDTHAVSLEAHRLTLQADVDKISAQLDGYLASLRASHIQQDHADLLQRVDELNEALKRDGRGSEVVKYLASRVDAIVVGAIGGALGNNPDSVLHGIQNLVHLVLRLPG